MNIRALVVFGLTLPSAVLAADISGTWKSEFDSQIGTQKYTFTFQQDQAKLTGKAASEIGDQKRETDLREGKVEGDAISFVEMLNFQDNEIRIAYTGKLSADGNEIKFSRAVGEFATEELVAKRDTAAASTASAIKAVRIRAGQSTPYTDSNGNVWLAEQGFEGGAVVERDTPLEIAGTKDPTLFSSEHYSMNSFSCKLPNGKYVARLYFAETYDGIGGPGGRVFTFNVHGREFKDFDVWVKAGGPYRAHMESVPVEITNGEFRITFTSQVENPQINAIEIVPQSETVPALVTPGAAATAPAAAAAQPATDTPPARGQGARRGGRGGGGGGQITLGPDDKAAFPPAPEGFDRVREGIERGKLERVDYESKTVGAARWMEVYTPPGYSSARKYPVLYLLHGIGGNENREWTRQGVANVVLDNLIADKKIEPMIVVFPNGNATSPNANAGGGGRGGGFGGWGAPFENDLLKDIIPFMEARYSVQGDRDHRALAGLSMGGGQSLNFGLGNLDVFAWVGGFSSAPNMRAPSELVPDPEKARQQLKLLYISCGNRDGLINRSQGLHAFLKENNVPHVWHVDGHAHDFQHWKEALYNFSQLIFKPRTI